MLCLVGALVVQGMVFVPPSAVAQALPSRERFRQFLTRAFDRFGATQENNPQGVAKDVKFATFLSKGTSSSLDVLLQIAHAQDARGFFYVTLDLHSLPSAQGSPHRQVFPPSQGSSAEAQELRAAARAVAARRDEYVQ